MTSGIFLSQQRPRQDVRITVVRSQSPPISPGEPWLAPMAGYTNLAFRMLCREFGASVACTEMVSAKGLVYRSPSTQRFLTSHPTDSPLVVQLFGSQPVILEHAVQMLRRQGFSWFDLNAGCPIKKVVQRGAGAALLEKPRLLEDVVRSMIEAAGPGCVGVKIRSGWEGGREAYLRIAERMGNIGLGWMSMHPRSAKQGFRGQADWKKLGKLQRAAPFPVIGSGDFFSARDALHCLRMTGIPGIMFARGALQDPAVFARFKAEARGVGCFEGPGGAPLARSGLGSIPAGNEEPTRMVREKNLSRFREGLGIVRRHIELSKRLTPDRDAFLKMRTVIPKYLNSFQGVRQLRRRMLRCQGWEELQGLLDELEAMV